MARAPSPRRSVEVVFLVLGLFVQACTEELVRQTIVSPNVPGASVAHDGGTPAQPCDGGTCPPGAQPECGDGRTEGAEQCDDGNDRAGDGCDSSCRTERCGDGRVDDDEECDDENRRDGDGCSAACTEEGPVCGDGEVFVASEGCDDGNLVSGDGCDDLCRVERCGNRRLDTLEECDPPTVNQCDASCKLLFAHCGDGEVQTAEGEHCDDGNEAAGDGCHGCRDECGDGVLDREIGEECEPVFALEGTCDATTCKRLPACGDGKVQASAGEQCDPSDGVGCVNCQLQTIEPPPDAGVGTGSDDCVPTSPTTVQFQNGTFDSDTAPWAPRTRVELARASVGASGAGSLQVRFLPHATETTGLEQSGGYQCVRALADARYTLRLSYNIPATNDAAVYPALAVIMYESPNCSGTGVLVTGPALPANVRGSWLSYAMTVDTSPLTEDADGVSILIQPSITKPRGVEGDVLWDDIALSLGSASAACGNCVVDAASGESCDDGNHESGDGCDGDCQEEICGDGVLEAPGEQCDDGNTVFGAATDECTPGCQLKSACDDCAAGGCAAEVSACLDLPGVAATGPRAGTSRATLCDALRACMHRTGCSGPTAISTQAGFGGGGEFPENCYCGTAGLDCFDGAANGSCRAEVEAALETTHPVSILGRLGGSDANHPAFAAVAELLECEAMYCPDACVQSPACGDGVEQDRTAAFAMSFMLTSGAQSLPCLDAYTATGTGCSFEECDDGNDVAGDGCDADCFVEACGNNLVQTDEECDDGNQTAGDGCDASCQAEFECGDSLIEAPFEACDPPDTGPNCTEAQYAQDPSQCGCDSQCSYKVCGNGVIQDGEQCDPPGPACSDTCETLEDECSSCIRLIDVNSQCGGALLLDGTGVPGDPFAKGCLNDPTCYALWQCERTSLCHWPIASDCYCGEVAPNLCEASSYVPVGVCKDEILAAFEAQFLDEPENNAEVLASFNALAAASDFASLSAANSLSSTCLIPDDPAAITTRDLFVYSGLPQDQIDACMSACFP